VNEWSACIWLRTDSLLAEKSGWRVNPITSPFFSYSLGARESVGSVIK